MALWVPPRVSRELREETLEFAGLVDRVCHKDRLCVEWDTELARLDPLLDMIKAPDQQVIGTPLVPGAYHVRRRNPGAPPSLIPSVDEDGNPREPPGMLLEKLKGMDLWNVNVVEMQKRIRDEEEARLERKKLRDRADRQERILDHYKAVTNASVSMNPDTAWGQNARGAAQARANKKKQGE